jgi:hypothetical protein
LTDALASLPLPPIRTLPPLPRRACPGAFGLPGRTLSWKELTKQATGATLNAKAFATDFKGN